MPLAERQDLGRAPEQSSANRFARNSAFGTVAGVLAAFSSVIASVIVAHALGVKATGVVAFALWVAMVAATVADFGIQQSLARYLPELTASGRLDELHNLVRALWRCLAVACGVTIIGFIRWASWRWQSGDVSGPDALLWSLVGVLCAVQALAGFTFGELRGLQQFGRLAWLAVISFCCQLVGVAAGSLALGPVGAIAGYCAGSVVPAALSLRHALPGASPSREIKRRVRRYALYAWAAALSSTFVWSRAELFFLQRSTGSEAVGLFTVAITLANLASQGPMLLTAGLLPHLAQSFGEGALDKMREAYAVGTRVLAFIVLPICCGFAAAMPVALPLMYGGAFANAVPAATVLVLAAGVGAICSVGSALIMAMDRSDLAFVTGFIAAPLAVVAGFTVIPTFGLMGAALSRAGIQLVAIIVASGFVYWRLGSPLPLRDLGRLFLAAALCGAAARGCLMITTGPRALVSSIVVGAVVYFVAVRVLRALRPADADRLRALCCVLPGTIRASCVAVIDLLAPKVRVASTGGLATPRLGTAGDGN